jgi:hypothetical protein
MITAQASEREFIAQPGREAMLQKSSRDFCCASKDENSGRSTKTKGSKQLVHTRAGTTDQKPGCNKLQNLETLVGSRLFDSWIISGAM